MGQSVAFLLAKDKAQYDAQIAEAQVRLTEAQILLVQEEIKRELLNAELIAAQAAKIRREIEMMDLQESLLNAQINLTTAQRTSTDAQSALVIQKTITEKAQTMAGAVEENSVVGKQKNLYQAQTNGYLRDAEQRAAKLMSDTWMTRRTTDEGTIADSTNKLNDATIGLAIEKMLAGVGITVP
jgi:plasmid replication initiation protein